MPKLTARAAAELVAVVGVIGSLGFVGWEIRQNTAAAKAQAYQEIGLAVAQAWGEVARDPGLLSVVVRASSPDASVAATLTEVERNQARALQIQSLRMWEIVYLNVQVGTLGPEAMDEMGNWNRICVDPHLSRDWDAIKLFLGDAFGQFVARTCGLPW